LGVSFVLFYNQMDSQLLNILDAQLGLQGIQTQEQHPPASNFNIAHVLYSLVNKLTLRFLPMSNLI
jgi:hypothetical protein